ncbi:MAG: fructosamine kinase family protein [Marinicella sp.]
MKFQKLNHNSEADTLFKEVDGLAYLNKVISCNNIPIKIPKVYSVNEQTLELEFINHKGGSKNQWQGFGSALAQFHLLQEKAFGWHAHNYIGLNPQKNRITSDWGTFFFQYRLTFQAELIKDVSVRDQFMQVLSSTKNHFISYLNQHSAFPSPLHGDLWSGNVLFDEHDVWLIDPAVYCGDAEADLAMTEMFGGFPAAFYQAYTAIKPLSKQYQLKKVIYNLYHQLNHYNLFGTSYLPGCNHGFSTLKNFFKPHK